MTDSLLPEGLPWQTASFAAQATERLDQILDSPVHDPQYNLVSATCCLNTASLAVLLDWPTAYLDDNDTEIIRDALLKYKVTALPTDIIKSVHMGYRSHLKAGKVVLLGNTLLLFKILKMQNKALSVIIVPNKIRRVLFDH